MKTLSLRTLGKSLSPLNRTLQAEVKSRFSKKTHSKEELAVESRHLNRFFFVYDTYNFINFLRKYGISMNYFYKMATVPLVSSVTFRAGYISGEPTSS